MIMDQDWQDLPAIARGIPLEEEPGLGALTLPGLLRDVTTRHADREVLVWNRPGMTPIRWSYNDLWDRSTEVARALLGCGSGKDSRIGLLMTNRPEWLSAMFGTSLAGATLVGLSTFSTPAELEFLIQSSAVSTLIVEQQVLTKDFAQILGELDPLIGTGRPGALASTKFPYLRRIVVLGDGPVSGAMESWQDFLAHGVSVPQALVDAAAASVAPCDPAVLFYSSGSTGKPKGILNSHRSVAIQTWRWTRIYAIDHPVRAWSANGLFWSGNFSLVLGVTLPVGGSIVLQATFNPADAIRLMVEEGVTFPYCWPHQWAQMEAEPGWDDADLSSLHYIDTERNLHRPHKHIPRMRLDPRASYGSTETFTISACFPIDAPRDLWEGCNGEALPGNTIKIVDPDTGKTLRRGETGEIAVKGPTLMLGYVGVPLSETLDADGFYRSGDGGHIDERGRLFFAGRINDIIKTGGANVSPVEVDWILCSCPGVKVCKTTGIPNAKLGEMVVSLVVAEADNAMSGDAIIAWLKERLASYKVPRKILFLDESDLNLTDTAKIKPAEARAIAQRILEGQAA